MRTTDAVAIKVTHAERTVMVGRWWKSAEKRVDVAIPADTFHEVR